MPKLIITRGNQIHSINGIASAVLNNEGKLDVEGYPDEETGDVFQKTYDITGATWELE